MKKMRIIPTRRVCGAMLLSLTFMLVACSPAGKTPPLSPEDALKTFQLPDGFRIELVAAEPLITDPVEIAFDAEGKLYVAEMEDYPAQGDAGGRIMLLEDLDDDGHFETGHVFADSLPYVNGVMPWRGGVLVTTAPNIIYLQDTTGDHRADIREVMLTGFAFTNPQLRVSSLRYGLDNWIYGAYSRAGGQRGYPEFANHGSALRFAKDPGADSADIYPGTDFRFRPDSFLIEPAGGMSQFGMSFDAQGNRFTVWNNIHLRHVVIDGRYPARNPLLKMGSLMASVSDHGDAATVYSRAENRLDLHESEMGHFTSACGHSVYTGGLFSPPYDGAAFVCEPVSNIVHVDVLKGDGATFSASRAEAQIEFLSSTDSWFRPVNTTVGPDGGLYVVDFYRKLVEHPAWIARADDKGIYTHAGVLQEKDFLEGNDRGRIYRIVPDDHAPAHARKPELTTASVDELVQELSNPNMWWRINAQRLLVERRDASSITPLKKILSSATSAETKIHALRTLEGLQALNEILIMQALSDESPVVKKQAVLMAESRLASPAIKKQVIALAADADEGVQFQVALTLGLLPENESFPPLMQILPGRLADEWFRTAVLLSARGNVMQWFRSASDLIASDETSAAAKNNFLRQLASIAGASQHTGHVSQLISFIGQVGDTAVQRAALEGMAEGVGQHGVRMRLAPPAQEDLLRLISGGNNAIRNAVLDLAEKLALRPSRAFQSIIDTALSKVVDLQAPTDERVYSIRVLGLEGKGSRIPLFAQLLIVRQPSEVQAAATQVLARSEDPRALTLLLTRWNSCTVEVRAIMEKGLMNSAMGLTFFLNAVKEKRVDPALLSSATRSRLLQHPDPTMRNQAEVMFAHLQPHTREDVIMDYHESTVLPGDAAKGKSLFRTVCSACHQLENVGRKFGPDLLSVSKQTRINLLTMILDPNNNIAPGYDGYFIETTEGRTFTGILGSETSSAVVLRTPDGEEAVIDRDRIKDMRPMTSSLMPEGLEAGLSKQNMADLLEYLKHAGGGSSQ